MNNDQTFWQAYVDHLKAFMRLQDWTVTVTDHAPENPDHVASIDPFYGRQVAAICLSRGFTTATPEEQRQTIVHELLHLHTNRTKNVFYRIIEGRTEGWLRLGAEFHNEATEYTTDIIADILAPFLPLPMFAERVG